MVKALDKFLKNPLRNSLITGLIGVIVLVIGISVSERDNNNEIVSYSPVAFVGVAIIIAAVILFNYAGFKKFGLWWFFIRN